MTQHHIIINSTICLQKIPAIYIFTQCCTNIDDDLIDKNVMIRYETAFIKLFQVIISYFTGIAISL